MDENSNKNLNQDYNTDSNDSLSFSNLAERLISVGTSKTADFIAQTIAKKQELERQKRLKQLSPMAKSASGGISGPFILTLGLVILAFSLGWSVVAYLLYHNNLTSIMIWAVIPFIISVYLIYKGYVLNRHATVFRTYKMVFGEKPYAKVDDLARAVPEKNQKTIKQLKKYESEGLYPQGRFNQELTYYVLSEGGFEILYEDLHKEELRKKQIKNKEKFEKNYPRLNVVVQEINHSVQTIDILSKEEKSLRKPSIRKNLIHIKSLLKQIRAFIIQNPDDVPDIKAFLDYFLPTLDKLLITYCELDNEKVQTKNVLESKAEIESVLETISKAFENLYDDFYSGTAMDVYSDVTVLNTMMKQHGLSDQDFKEF